MIRRFLRDEAGISRIEYGLYFVSFGFWCFVILESLGAVSI